MKRLVLNDLGYIERLFDRASRRSLTWSRALYPPGCDPRRGSAEFRAAPEGSIVLQVERRDLACEDFRLRMMFAAGVAVFSSPRDLDTFAKHSLARAFGIEVNDQGPAETPNDPELVPPVEPAGRPETKRRERPALRAATLAETLAHAVKGQDAALERVAHVVCAQLTKEAPARPATVLLLGPTGTGKTSTIEALPRALRRFGHSTRLFRIDCNELTHSFQASRLIGAPPGYVGYGTTPALVEALEHPSCILLLDEVEKAHPSILGDVLLNLLDTGMLTSSGGKAARAPHAVIAMTSNLATERLTEALAGIPLGDRWAVQRVCRQVLAREGMAPELLGRIGAFAVYGPLDEDSHREAALAAVEAVAGEYSLGVASVEPVVIDVVLDIAGESALGARSLHYAAGELLVDALIEARLHGVAGRVRIEAGPPISIAPSGARRG